MNTKTRLLVALLEDRFAEYSIRGLAQKTSTDYKNTYQVVKQLDASINKRKVGSSVLIAPKSVLTDDIFQAEKKRIEQLKLPILVQDIQAVKNPFFIAVVFGSYAKHTRSKLSDIDLCIISDNSEIHEILSKKLSIFPTTVEIHSFSTEEFLSMVVSKQPSIAHEIIRYGVPVRNCEGYYDLIKHGF